MVIKMVRIDKTMVSWYNENVGFGRTCASADNGGQWLDFHAQMSWSALCVPFANHCPPPINERFER